ncbi:hypothetical protein KL919_001866 [Ogataea angusta]|uniref:WW domain-containing protein n=1 Tax=Pichia angusta TaxID=870730 RepID=A0AAN6DFY3_PICAN|nr:uncharacterized protein KL928_002454 [Ogataea angusta]KAG7819780.1 hypothetical protein KL928_002454 [Ogataea angusta]KAG7830649.1 hypothetical protein KL920_001240 [Ogataea angusta]KAG7849090.1 hypothetical protein KL941_001908 [Ogataea angusta]KAG7855703.1 hypothetical protein KL939_004167 [Ogataea angusta]KAG7861132.1 hypothetical protein KL919_001866 [Ogataea angusta]
MPKLTIWWLKTYLLLFGRDGFCTKNLNFQVLSMWSEVVDEEGRVYYYNSETEQTQWERPEDLKESRVDAALEKTKWQRYLTDEGEVYYYNEETEESVWTLPDEVRKLISPVAVEEPESAQENGDKAFDSTKIVDLSSFFTDEELRWEKNTDGKTDQFVQMLEDYSVGTDWTFQQVMERCIVDKRYWTLPDSISRKECFEVYLLRKADEEFREKENSRESYRNAFFQVLDNYDIKYYTRWNTCAKLIMDEPIYSLIPPKMKREFFEEYVGKLKRASEAEIKEARRKELEEVEVILRSELTLKSQVDDAFKTVDMERLPYLNKLDILTIYENIMNELERSFQATVSEHDKKNYRADRKARDGFKQLLEEVSKKIEFTAKLRWHELLRYIKDDPRFINLCGRKGSLPIDFYWDILDKENQSLKAKRDLVKHIIPTADNMSLEEFTRVVTQKVDNVSESDCRLIREMLLEEGKQKGEGDRRKRLMTLGYGVARS